MNGPFVSLTAAQRTVAGIAALIVGAVCIVLAAGIAWRSVQRWQAVGELRAAHLQLHQGRVSEARRLAAAAAERLPHEPAPALLAIDPADPAAAERLAALAAACKHAHERQAVLATLGLLQALAGRKVEVDLSDSGDGRALAAIAAARGRQMAKLAFVEGEAPPHRQVLVAAHAALLRQALRLGSADDARLHAGALLLLDPRHPRASTLCGLLTALNPAAGDEEALRAIAEARDEAEPLARAVAALAPGRRAAIAGRWPSAVGGGP